jgi:N-formylmaleamate deformylase
MLRNQQQTSDNSNTDQVKRYRTARELVPFTWSEVTVEANGIRQHYYRTGGAKPALVLLHGYMEGALAWLRLARLLEKDYDLIMVDARGHGQSGRITTGFTPELLTEDAAGVITVLNLRSPRVLGFSQGAATAVRLAAAHPDLVHAVVAAGWPEPTSQAPISSPGYHAWLDAYTAWLKELKTQTHEERMVSALAHLPPRAPLLPEEEYVPWVQNCAALDLDMVEMGDKLWAQQSQDTAESNQALLKVKCPVLILKSAFFPKPGAPQSVEQEASEQPNVKTLRFVNTGHLIHHEQVDEFMRVVSDFFASH